MLWHQTYNKKGTQLLDSLSKQPVSSFHIISFISLKMADIQITAVFCDGLYWLAVVLRPITYTDTSLQYLVNMSTKILYDVIVSLLFVTKLDCQIF
jgi:hypothetical protein